MVCLNCVWADVSNTSSSVKKSVRLRVLIVVCQYDDTIKYNTVFMLQWSLLITINRYGVQVLGYLTQGNASYRLTQ